MPERDEPRPIAAGASKNPEATGVTGAAGDPPATAQGPAQGSRTTSAQPEDTAQARIRRLRWAAVVGPIVFVSLLELTVQALHPTLLSWPGRLVMAGVVAIGLVFFFGGLFSVIENMHRSLTRRNRELLALHHASLDIYGELSLDIILKKVVDQTRVLLGAAYGAVSVISSDGIIDQFVTSGIDDETRARLGAPPTGRGVLGVPLNEGQSLRLRDLARHPRAAGFPEHHPPMKSLLAVPISCKGSFRGNLYLSDKLGGEEFTDDDEATLTRFAQQVAIAIDNADLHRQLSTLAISEERTRIAREMHDGMSQVLAYVNTKAQAVRQHLSNERPNDAAKHLEQLAGAAREAYGEVREGILALRTTPDAEEGLAGVLERYVEQWRAQSNLDVRLEVDDVLEIDGTVELQLLRIVQEALSNARKHSGATRATVEVHAEAGHVTGTIEDNGRGFDGSSHPRSDRPRFGLKIMRERAESVGGTLSVESRLGLGTRVTIKLPITSERTP